MSDSTSMFMGIGFLIVCATLFGVYWFWPSKTDTKPTEGPTPPIDYTKGVETYGTEVDGIKRQITVNTMITSESKQGRLLEDKYWIGKKVYDNKYVYDKNGQLLTIINSQNNTKFDQYKINSTGTSYGT